MSSLRHDDVAVFLRRAEGTAKILGTKVEQFSSRVRLLPRRPSGVYATRPASLAAEPAPSLQTAEPVVREREEELALAAEELRVQQDQLELACELLERERAKYMDLFEQSPDAYVATDMAGLITNANVAAGALFGVEPGLLVGKPLISFVARQDTRAFREELRELKDAPDVRSMTLRMRPRGGGVFVVALCVRVVRGLRGKPMAFRCTLRKTDTPSVNASWLDDLVALTARESASSDVVDLAEHLDHAANAVRGAAAARSVRVVLDSERRNWRVRSQVAELRRMLEVFLMGAVAATPNEGELRVRVVLEGEQAVLDVTPGAEHEGAPTIRIRLPLQA
ncbi:MAG TPA: PAS domain-containing protein [Polyangiaceae bacterium]|nr:PAS domain-containing protein [Polyangiaceae bacterium]